MFAGDGVKKPALGFAFPGDLDNRAVVPIRRTEFAQLVDPIDHAGENFAGPTARFEGQIYHHTYASFSEYLEQLERFSSLAARDRFEEGQRAQWLHVLCHPPAIFLKNYLLRLGFLDGKPGLAVSILAAVSSLFKDLKLWEIQSGSAKEMPMNSRDA